MVDIVHLQQQRSLRLLHIEKDKSQKVIDVDEEQAKIEDIIDNVFDEKTEQDEESDDASWGNQKYYHWRNHFRGGSFLQFLRWLSGGADSSRIAHQTDEEIKINLLCMARLLRLLRVYYSEYGIPQLGGPKDQEFVLREVTRDLYAGGAPLWVLQPAMEKAAEGLTGKKGVDFFLLPRKAFVFAPSSGATSMFKIQRGFDIQRLTMMERILVRLASFASNTHGVSSLPTRLPTAEELLHALTKEKTSVEHDDLMAISQDEMAKQILELGSQAEGLFYFINSEKRPDTTKPQTQDEVTTSTKRHHRISITDKKSLLDHADNFWIIEEHICELFSHLACQEAIASIDQNDKKLGPVFPWAWRALFQFICSFGAAAFWYGGSWIDAICAGGCGVLVYSMSSWSVLSLDERIIFEVVAALIVGTIAGFISIHWPSETCMGAIALGGVLDILQGFKIVYSVIELLSKHTVPGGADFLEGILYTGLIAYFLRLGNTIATSILGRPGEDNYLTCNNQISEWWYLLLVPITAASWSALFNPKYKDLALMTYHGVLGFALSWALSKTQNIDESYNLFISAAAVTLSSGLVSRFNGRQAMGNAVAGLYVLLPGSYVVRQLFDDTGSLEFLTVIFFRASVIGLGAWTGTLLCSPIILGITGGQAQAMRPSNATQGGARSFGFNSLHREEQVRKKGTGTVLFF